MDATAIMERLDALGVTVTVTGDRLRLEPGSLLPAELIKDLRQHKHELLALLSKPQVMPRPQEWHAQEIARAVEREGVCIFWSDLFGETIAFVKDDSYRGCVPLGIVTYTGQELRELFRNGKNTLSPQSLRLVHEAKKHGGGHIMGYEAEWESMGDG